MVSVLRMDTNLCLPAIEFRLYCWSNSSHQIDVDDVNLANTRPGGTDSDEGVALQIQSLFRCSKDSRVEMDSGMSTEEFTGKDI